MLWGSGQTAVWESGPCCCLAGEEEEEDGEEEDGEEEEDFIKISAGNGEHTTILYHTQQE